MSLTAFLFLAAFAAGSVLAFARAPIYGLVTYVAVFYVHPPSRWWGQGALEDIRWSLIAAGVALLAVLVRKTRVELTPVFRSGPFWVLFAFVIWIAIQSLWALDSAAHAELLSIYWKLLLVMILITRCIETEADLRLFMWSHVLGCGYLGWIAYTSYKGGRFEDFGGPGIGEANAAALVLVTGMAVAGSLFLAGGWRQRVGVVGVAPFLANAVVTTISRSGFLATAVAGLAFNWLTPARYRPLVRLLSLLAVVLFAMVASDSYWKRIDTIKYGAEEIEGVDTGAGRLATIEAQVRMFKAHPLGCGHACTTYLSYTYLDPKYHAVQGGRASHNTFMTMLVDHGVVGGTLYIMMVWWVFRSLRRVSTLLSGTDGFMLALMPAVGAVMLAMFVGDMFAQYSRLEVRIWFVATLMVMLHFAGTRRQVA